MNFRNLLLALLLCSSSLLLASCERADSQSGSNFSNNAVSQTVNPTILPTTTLGPSTTPLPTPRSNPKATYDAMLNLTQVADGATAIARQTAIAATPHMPLPTETPQAPRTPQPVIAPLGLTAWVDFGVRICDCTLENGWQEIINGEYLSAVAGVWDEYPEQRRGLLMVETRTLDNLKTTSQDFYESPLQAGKLRLIAANTPLLTLEAVNGQRFIFDLRSRTWIDPPPGAPSYPTLTPLPTFPSCGEENMQAEEECRAQHQQTWEAWVAADALTPTHTPLPTVTVLPTQLALGIFNNTDPIWPTSKYIFTNGWRDLANSAYLTVYAGGYRDNPQQGVIFVMKRSADYREVTELAFYETPAPAGSLRITAVDGLRLTLTTANNQPLIFDIATRQWGNP